MPERAWAGGGMVYTADLKSAALTGLRVRVPPRLPEFIIRFIIEIELAFGADSFYKCIGLENNEAPKTDQMLSA